MVEEFIPIVMFACIALVLCVSFWLKYRARSDAQQTIRAVLDKGQELSPELIDQLGNPKRSRFKDLRLGTIWLALAFGLVLCGLAIPEDDGMALRGTLAGAAFPFAIGVAYLLLYRFVREED